jgi:hypothetical protein
MTEQRLEGWKECTNISTPVSTWTLQQWRELGWQMSQKGEMEGWVPAPFPSAESKVAFWEGCNGVVEGIDPESIADTEVYGLVLIAFPTST